MTHSWGTLAAFAYYANDVKQAISDAYFRSGCIASEWFGGLAESWRLAGEVTQRAFSNLAKGYTPDGVRAVVQNAGKKRHAGDDHTADSNKEVSLLWALEGARSIRKAIERCVLDATRDMLRFQEETSLYSRRGAGGAVVEKASAMVAALFLHFTNRRNEPHLHVHCAVFNQVLRPSDNTIGTIVGITAKRDKTHVLSRSPFYVNTKEYGQVFQESLRARMEALGYRTADAGPYGRFTIVGMPKELVERFSSRAKDIKEDMERRGVSGSKEAHRSAVLTRPAKKNVPLDQLLPTWREQANGWDPATIRREHITTTSIASPAVSPELRARVEAKAWAHVQPVKRRTATKKSERQEAAAQETKPATPPERDRRGGEELRCAAQMADLMKRARRSRGHILTAANVYLAEKQLAFVQRSRLTPQEHVALQDITRKRGTVQFLGEGVNAAKVLAAAHMAWGRQGYRVLGVSRSRAAADQLQGESGIHSMTVTGLLRSLSENRGLLAGYDAAMKKSFALGPTGFRNTGGFINYALKAAGRHSLDKKTVLVVEQPSALTSSEHLEILKRAQKAGAKVVFVDSRRQPSDIAQRLVYTPPKTEHVPMQRRRTTDEAEEQQERNK